ncbi:MAG: host attachment protein [Gammaproteobacteria bacterium]|nr:host attachment protein [Gammaproteobacteria bacterium]
MADAARRADKTYWIVVADESHAVIYTRNTKRGPLQKLLSLDNAAGRKKTGELLADRGGRSYDSFGTGRHTMAKEKTDPKKHVAMAFARQIAERVGKVTHDGSCRGYALLAPPRFLGMLRDAVSNSCKFEPFKTIDKEVVDKDTAFLKKLVDSD